MKEFYKRENVSYHTKKPTITRLFRHNGLVRFVVSVYGKLSPTFDLILTHVDIKQLPEIPTHDQTIIHVKNYDKSFWFVAYITNHNYITVRVYDKPITGYRHQPHILMRFKDMDEYTTLRDILISNVDESAVLNKIPDNYPIKECVGCGEFELLDDFMDLPIGKKKCKDGKKNMCIGCDHAQHWYEKLPDDEKLKLSRKRKSLETTRNEYTAYMSEYRDKNRDELRRKSLEYKERRRKAGVVLVQPVNKEHERAGVLLRIAKRNGDVTIGPCYVCGSTDRPRASHVSYDYHKLDFEWLCSLCLVRHKHHKGSHFCLLPKSRNSLTIAGLIIDD